MNTDDLKVLARRADGVEGHGAGRLDEVHERIGTARRRRAAVAGVAAVAAVLAVVIGTSLLSDPRGRGENPVKPTPTPSPSEEFRIPAGQRTIEADVRPGDVRGLEAVATVTNTQPGRRGATELGTTVNIHTETTYLVYYCHSADPSVWFFTTFTDGGAGYGRCDEGSAALPKPDLPASELTLARPQATTVRMIVTRPTPQFLACYRTGVEDCSARYGPPQPLATTDAEFGFRMYDHAGAPVLRLFGNGYQAMSTIDGQAWIVDRAVLAAPGAGRLAFRLPDAKHRWLVGLFQDWTTPHKQACIRWHGLDTYPEGNHVAEERAIDRACGTRLRLLVDGTFRPYGGNDDTTYGDPWTYVAPGAHEVTVDATKGDPRNARYAVLVWKAGS